MSDGHEWLQDWIGREAVYTAPEPLGRAAIRCFALAVGDENPVYVDDDAARRAGHDGVVAPATLVCETNQFVARHRPVDGYPGHVWNLPGGPYDLVRGGNEYTFGRPVRPDDVVTVRWRLTDARETLSERLGPLLVVTSQADYRAADGELLATNIDTTLYVRRTPGGTPGGTR